MTTCQPGSLSLAYDTDPMHPAIAATVPCGCCVVAVAAAARLWCMFQLVSRDVFTKLRAQAEQRRRQGWSRIHWELLDEDNLVKGVKQLQARYAQGMTGQGQGDGCHCYMESFAIPSADCFMRAIFLLFSRATAQPPNQCGSPPTLSAPHGDYSRCCCPAVCLFVHTPPGVSNSLRSPRMITSR